MKTGKKLYSTPRLVVHGSFETITKQGGGDYTDVPMGTSINNPGGISGPLGS